jgi:predicted alpha-1,2-mannosidase
MPVTSIAEAHLDGGARLAPTEGAFSQEHSLKTLPTVFLLAICGVANAQTDLASYVDPFIGTETNSQKDSGHTVPGATRPFGMLYWSPDPDEGPFYFYEKTVTRGFSLTHISGTGCGIYGDVPLMPILGLPREPPPVRSTPYSSTYKHSDEVAQPGYYSVKLDSGITVQIAAQVHSGIAEIDYPDGADPHTLLIDLSRNLTHVYDAQIDIGGRSVTGSVASGGFCGLDNRYRVYFVIETEEPPQSSGTFDEMRVNPGVGSAVGPRTGGYLAFGRGMKALHLKVGLSFVSVANAAMNLAKEIPGWDFARVRTDARAAWNETLAHVVVNGGVEARRKTFYTALYHSFLHPTVFNDVNGEYIGFDGKIRTLRGRSQYANFSEWDIYRSQVQLIAMLMPKVASDIAQSLVNDAEQGGGLPIWPVANDESSCMVGDPADGILASIYAFGARDFDTHAALQAMLRGGDSPRTHIRLFPERPGLAEFLSRGYIADGGRINGAASVTLEDENADFAIARFAASLGDTATAARYLERSDEWRKLFDPETKYIRARGSDGEFLPDFKPEKIDGFVEGNAAQYTWMVPYNLKDLIAAVGGGEAARVRLDDYFSHYGTWFGGPYFFIANEPSFGNPWTYNWSGHPWRTQEVVRKTLDDLFMPTPDGEPGNDDLGATSSWVVFASLGFYPEIPGVGGLATSTPVFPQAELKLGSHTLRISAPGAPDKLYVKNLSIDGKPVLNWWLDWDALQNASEVDFTLASEPNRDAGETPPSFGPDSMKSSWKADRP